MSNLTCTQTASLLPPEAPVSHVKPQGVLCYSSIHSAGGSGNLPISSLTISDISLSCSFAAHFKRFLCLSDSLTRSIKSLVMLLQRCYNKNTCSNIVATMADFIKTSALVAECSYCGDSANCFDHVVPLSYVFSGKRTNAKNRSETTVVPCCNECNHLLGCSVFPSVSEKAGFLAERIAIRYKRILNAPYWSEEDYNELSGRLKQAIKAKQAKRQVVLERIRHCLFVAHLEELTIADIWAAYKKGMTLAEYVSGTQKACQKISQETL